ncbi:MAG: acyltransferase [bacterium]|nr:acyltransferase [bacterium]
MSDKKRFLYIDNLRILLVFLVIIHHTAETYGAGTGWYYREATTDILTSSVLTLLVVVNQAFFMGLFFLISAYFVPASFNQKGIKEFLKWRFLRLGIPVLFFGILIAPVISYASSIAMGKINSSFMEYLPVFFSTCSSLSIGPMWFVEALLIFTVIYVLIRKFIGKRPEAQAKPFPGNLTIAAFALITGLVTFLVRIRHPIGTDFFHFQLSFFAQYIGLFVIGIIASSNNWLEEMPVKTARTWSIITLILLLLLPVLFFLIGADKDASTSMGGFSWQSCLYSVWEQFFGTGTIIFLIAHFRKRHTEQGSLLKGLSDSAYAAYIFHSPVLIGITIVLGTVSFHPLIKFFLVSFVAITASFAIGAVVRKMPLARHVL